MPQASTILGNEQKICISNLNEINIVPIPNIVRCESRSNYTTIHLIDKVKLVASKPLCDFEELLEAHNFCRVHNSHLVNMAFVKSFKKNNGYFITLFDDTDITVSTRKKEVFMQKLKEISCAIL